MERLLGSVSSGIIISSIILLLLYTIVAVILLVVVVVVVVVVVLNGEFHLGKIHYKIVIVVVIVIIMTTITTIGPILHPPGDLDTKGVLLRLDVNMYAYIYYNICLTHIMSHATMSIYELQILQIHCIEYIYNIIYIFNRFTCFFYRCCCFILGWGMKMGCQWRRPQSTERGPNRMARLFSLFLSISLVQG